MAEATYLKKKSDPRPIIPVEDLYIWNPILAEREDMEVYVPGQVSVSPVGLQPPSQENAIVIDPSDFQPGDSVKLSPEDELNTMTVDPNRIKAIVEAIGKLDPKKDYTKKTPQREAMPRVESIERLTGFKLEPGERDIALEAMKAA
ncbi:hypothetical protein [Candidatus Manganitrophus noduliformans]|uniref:Uncharacterized protein n=1 Tax=Candidatus Manganitrophus noduliformans TaxID=2606439 RepID=A0A7X6IA02_9BACT|nr:hypothetical protein [Candidatus Manganitrophus noduliformans]NKE69895.1 hypothetical protein [Candidatus Manganitrophus noduliformans]